MNAKKILALVLALVLCVGTLAACESKPAETTKPAGTTAPATTAGTTAPPETTAPVIEQIDQVNAEFYPIDFAGTLTAATTRTNANESHNYLLMEELTGVDIEWQISAQEQIPLLFLDAATMPDIFFGPSGVSVTQMQEFGKAGMLVNFLDEEILNMMPNLKANYEADPRLFDGVKTADGEAYSLPYYCYTLTMASNLFYVRTDMTKEAGIEELPTTIEGFLEMLATLKEYYKDVPGYEPMVSNGEASVRFNNAYANFFFPAFGEEMVPGIGVTLDGQSIYAGFATEQFKRYITFMNTLYEEGYLDDECFVADSATNKARLIDKTTTINPFATFLTPANFASGELDFQVMPVLTSEYQSEARWTIPNRYRTTTYAINAALEGEELAAACAFLDACYAPMDNPIRVEGDKIAWGQALWMGELNEDFVLDEENGTYEILPHEGFDSGSAWLTASGHGSSLFLYWPYAENSGTGLMMKAIGSRDILEPNGVYVLDVSLLIRTEEEIDIYNDCWTDIANYIAEMNAAFLTGQADIEAEWDNYVAKLYEMGLQDVLDGYQAALDRYNGK